MPAPMSHPYAIITGASRGLGAEFALQFFQAGYNLCLISRGQDELEAFKQTLLAKQTATSGNYILCLEYNLGNQAALESLAQKILTQLPSIDVLINNAAIQGPIGSLQDNDWQAWQETLAINLLAPVFLTKTLLPRMMAQKSGTIINLSGGGATGPRGNFSAYASAKTALVRFTETIAQELETARAQGVDITINALAPGAMATRMLREVLDKGASASGSREFTIAEKILSEGGASMIRVAELALFLSSPRGRAITGKLISAMWDKWADWPDHQEALNRSDVYTLRRITGRDRGFDWGDL